MFLFLCYFSLFSYCGAMHISSNAISTLHPLNIRSVSVFVWIFLLFFEWSAFVVCMLHVSWLLICFAFLGMDTSLSIVILSLLIFSMMIVNIFFRHRRRRCCRCYSVIASFYIDSLDVTMCVQAAHLHWYSSSFMVQIEFNTLESSLEWSFKRKRERERERQWKHLLMCVRSCMEKRQMCSACTWHSQNALGMSFKYLKTPFKSYLRMYYVYVSLDSSVNAVQFKKYYAIEVNAAAAAASADERCAVVLRFILFHFPLCHVRSFLFHTPSSILCLALHA